MAMRLRIGLSAAAFLAATSWAQAGCALSDIAGVWLLEGVGGGVAGHCNLVINASGILQSTSTCRYDEPETLRALTVYARGSLTLQNAGECRFGGNLSITGTRASTARVTLRMSKAKDELIASGPVISTLAVPLYKKDAVVAFSAFRRVP